MWAEAGSSLDFVPRYSRREIDSALNNVVDRTLLRLKILFADLEIEANRVLAMQLSVSSMESSTDERDERQAMRESLYAVRVSIGNISGNTLRRQLGVLIAGRLVARKHEWELRQARLVELMAQFKDGIASERALQAETELFASYTSQEIGLLDLDGCALQLLSDVFRHCSGCIHLLAERLSGETDFAAAMELAVVDAVQEQRRRLRGLCAELPPVREPVHLDRYPIGSPLFAEVARQRDWLSRTRQRVDGLASRVTADVLRQHSLNANGTCCVEASRIWIETSNECLSACGESIVSWDGARSAIHKLRSCLNRRDDVLRHHFQGFEIELEREVREAADEMRRWSRDLEDVAERTAKDLRWIMASAAIPDLLCTVGESVKELDSESLRLVALWSGGEKVGSSAWLRLTSARRAELVCAKFLQHFNGADAVEDISASQVRRTEDVSFVDEWKLADLALKVNGERVLIDVKNARRCCGIPRVYSELYVKKHKLT